MNFFEIFLLTFVHLYNVLSHLQYCAVKKVFCKNYVRKCWKKDSKIQKNLKTIRKRFQLLPNASQCIPMGPNGSESLKKLAKTSKYLWKLWKTSQKLRKTSRKIYKNFFHGVVLISLFLVPNPTTGLGWMAKLTFKLCPWPQSA